MGMTIYKDLVSGDEVLSDSYKPKDVDDVVYEVDCTMVQTGGETYNTGANASAEEAEDALEDEVKKVNNVVSGFRLQELAKFDAKAYQAQLKGFLKKVKEAWKANGKSDDQITKYQKDIQSYYVKVIKENFKDYDFYTGESLDEDGMVLLLNYRDDGVTPYFIIWKHALKEEKV